MLSKDIVLLDDLHPSAHSTPHKAGGVVLSLEVLNGAVASHDFALGKVHDSWRVSNLFKCLSKTHMS